MDLAWQVIDEVFDEWGGVVSATKKGMLWKPMRKLMTKARAARKAELEREFQRRKMYPSDGTLGPSSVQPVNGMPHGMPNGMSNEMSNGISHGILNGMPSTSVLPLHNAAGLMMPITAGNQGIDPMAQQPMPMQPPQDAPQLGQLGVDVLRLAPGVEQQPSAQQQGMWNYNGQMAMSDTPLMGGESTPNEVTNWDGWDDIVRDFQINANQEQGFDANQVITGPMGDWW